MKKILLTGVNGQVGYALQKKLIDQEVFALSREQLDLSDAQAIRRVVQSIQPDLIINPAAYTAVDKAETEPGLAFAINAIAPQILAEEAAKMNAALIHFSTDYVYDGSKTSAYIEADAVNPLSIYGKSKLAGEDAIRSVGLPHLILRTSWVYGAYGKNFLKTILRLASERENLSIVADQYGAPTSNESIADAVISLLTAWNPENLNQTGVYHLTNQGRTSWHGFSAAIVDEYNQLAPSKNWPPLKTTVGNIMPITTADYPTPAARPTNSSLDNQKLKQVFNVELPTWQQGLRHVMQTIEL
ncbi:MULTISPECIES: dTDP-4-dehydrorhamnose reductase [Methylotenera]|uniref:dTDP-4-dehydrorhamnose reductase n=1 Tax=Methylotenera TaxID=359407 RepID=UPI00037089C0|nr:MULTISPECIES: dTDP-4-dehydrorhamnose reductase [Methylotenera]